VPGFSGGGRAARDTTGGGARTGTRGGGWRRGGRDSTGGAGGDSAKGGGGRGTRNVDAHSQTVYVLDAGGKPQPHRIRTGITDGTYTELLSGDLAVGSQVIVGAAVKGAAPTATTLPPGMGGGRIPGGGGGGPRGGGGGGR
jgi:HlyD family secretion protein